MACCNTSEIFGNDIEDSLTQYEPEDAEYTGFLKRMDHSI